MTEISRLGGAGWGEIREERDAERRINGKERKK
jgi:hypothetical protein